MHYANPWSGKRQFYKGRRKKLLTAETDKDYIAYCERKQNKANIVPYKKWVRQERKKYGLF